MDLLLGSVNSKVKLETGRIAKTNKCSNCGGGRQSKDLLFRETEERPFLRERLFFFAF